MYENARRKSTPRRLLLEVIESLENRFGSETAEECLRLAQIDTLLRRVELAMYADPVLEWPRVPPGNRVVNLVRTFCGRWAGAA
ncbi:MAG: hypothetical protein WB992_25125 [Bryobacteraceae bacterium]